MYPRLYDVPGLAQCRVCPYLISAPAELCYECARRSIEALAPYNRRCEICDRPFDRDEDECHNPLCSRADRHFQWNFSIAMRSGALESAINDYKYNQRAHG